MMRKDFSGRRGRLIFAACCVSALAACGGGGSDLAGSAVRAGFTPLSGSQVDVALSSEANGFVEDAAVGLAAYVSGLDVQQGQAVALAGTSAGISVGAPVTTGTATYNTQYGYTGIDDVTRDSEFIRGNQFTLPPQSITLTADFDAGTLSGDDGILDMDATISGQSLGGSAIVTHPTGSPPVITGTGTVPVTVQGSIGSTGVIGSFAGSDSNTVISGGFVGTP